MTIEQNKKDEQWEIECDLCHETTTIDFADAKDWSAMTAAIKSLGWKIVPLDRLGRPLAHNGNAGDFQHQCADCSKNPEPALQGRFL